MDEASYICAHKHTLSRELAPLKSALGRGLKTKKSRVSGFKE